MVNITEVSAMVAAAGVLVGVVYYILYMRNQAKTRQTDMVMRLYSTRGSKEFQESLKNVMTAKSDQYEDYQDWWG
jgi:hypothetical protein